MKRSLDHEETDDRQTDSGDCDIDTDEDHDYDYSFNDDEDEPSKNTSTSVTEQFNSLEAELQACCRGVCLRAVYPTGNCVKFQLEMTTGRLEIDDERMMAYGIDSTLPIVTNFEMTFESHDKISLVVESVYQRVGDDKNSKRTFHVGTLLYNRLKEYVKYIDKVSACETSMIKLMESVPCSRAKARFFLDQAKGDVNVAILAMLEVRESVPVTTTTKSCDQNVPHAHAYSEEDGEKSDLEEKGDSMSTTTTTTTTTSSLVNTFSSISNSVTDAIQLLLLQSPHGEERIHGGENVLVQLVHLIEGEIRTCGCRCLICNENVPYPGIVPLVCGKELCVMSYEELGVGVDLHDEILRDPSLLDLLISLFYSWAHSTRCELMFPTEVRAFGEDGVERSFILEVRAPCRSLWQEITVCYQYMTALHCNDTYITML
jgi:hypothetical protein